MDSVVLTISCEHIVYTNYLIHYSSENNQTSAMADTAVENRITSPHNSSMEKKDSAYKRVSITILMSVKCLMVECTLTRPISQQIYRVTIEVHMYM